MNKLNGLAPTWKTYSLNIALIFSLMLIFVYITTLIHELGHAAMILASGGDLLDITVNQPLSFDSISGYVVTNLPYDLPTVIGGILATTAVALLLFIFARHTLFSYLMFCLTVSTLYNMASALGGNDDVTWLATYSWWSLLITIGLLALNLYIAQQGLKDMIDDLAGHHTVRAVSDFIRDHDLRLLRAYINH